MSRVQEIMKSVNMYHTREEAMREASPDMLVRVGFPNVHLVYRMNDKRELSFQFHYDASKFGVLKAFQKAYPV